jgi:hypothetical protein
MHVLPTTKARGISSEAKSTIASYRLNSFKGIIKWPIYWVLFIDLMASYFFWQRYKGSVYSTADVLLMIKA